jgi:DNA modification methylase
MILVGDALACLRAMPSDSVHCVVTSPPYWGLRDYGVPPRIWGGTRIAGTAGARKAKADSA